MVYVVAALGVLDIVLLFCLFLKFRKYNRKGFDKNGIHRNGTPYDNKGFDCNGYDKDGYSAAGYDLKGFDRQGYNRFGYDKDGFDRRGFNAAGYDIHGFDAEGYNSAGKNAKGQYDRIHDRDAFSGGLYSVDGFLRTRLYPVKLSPHAMERMNERMGIVRQADMEKLATEAYRFGKSKRQVMRSIAAKMQEKEQDHEGRILLLYRNYVYVFSKDNCLVTLFPNENLH
jgi:hypothetical protein